MALRGTSRPTGCLTLHKEASHMRTRTVLLLAILALLALFTALNLNAFLAPTTLSLAFAQVQAPLGLVMLGVVALLSALFLAFALSLQAGSLSEARRFARDLEAQRTLADRAEESRFVDLQGRLAQTERALHHRIDSLDQTLSAALERNEAAFAAYIGELDDRIARAGITRASSPG
jgi:uncharacterized integral membrane protein